MKLNELKQEINNKEAYDNLFIFQYEDNSFVCEQYINAIARIRKREVKYIDKLNTQPVVDIFDTIDNTLNVLKTDKFDYNVDLLSDIRNTIIVCKETTCTDYKYLVVFPKLFDWQIKEYVKYSCPGLKPEQIDKLVKQYSNIYALENELDKIKLFNSHIQDVVFDEIFVEDKNIKDVFALSTNIIRHNLNELKHISSNIDASALISVLRTNIENLIYIQMNPNLTNKDMNMSYKQFMAIKYNVNKFSNKKLIDKYDFLTRMDMNIRQGLVDLNNEQLLNYVMCEVLN